jgi:hypothetical protein
MKTLQSYLEGIRLNPTIGWQGVYSDILGSHLWETERFLKGVELFGEEFMFEAVIVTASKKLSSDPLNYVLAVARQLWKDSLKEELAKDQDELRLERARRHVKEDNDRLAEKIERAKRRTDASDPL